ncbi:PfkB family carbohydrate kinase [Sandarakinorhabdus sp.]|uniref:PfkB family carbohydrate kinase n=1 Tax=Sandarakinorhabdus sp. TaxID=1916663 RepID=UPI00286D7B7F|nr:PfkB family carbohydrate kinase [Sandarakinorhabdus sp.]
MPPPRRIIAIGHAALDRIYRISAFPPHPTKVRALEHIEVGGGMAANASVAMARLGGKVELWSRVGDDSAGQIIRAGLKAEKVDVRYVQQFEDARSSTSAIIVDDRGERLIVNNRDTGMPSSTGWLPLERIKGCGAVLGDIRWLEGLRTTFTHARSAKVPTVLDADLGAREVLPELLALTDYAIFSQPALGEFPGGTDERSRLQAIAALGVKHAGVTRGERGYLWLEGGAFHEIAAPVVEVIDTTGAGDAFHGAFALMLSEGCPSEVCARAGAFAAAEKCTRLGGRAGLPTRKRLEALMQG